MTSHCRCCSGKFLEGDVLGDCPGCPECKELEDLYHATVKDMQDTSQQRADILNTIAGQRDAALEVISSAFAYRRTLEARIAYLESYVDGNDLRSDYPTATAMRQALERAEQIIAELLEEAAQAQNAAGA